MPLTAKIILACMLLVYGGHAQTLQGNRVSPYKKLNATQPLQWLPLLTHPFTDSAFAALETEKSLCGEARALMYEFRQYNLSAPPHKTDGRSNFEDAERPFMAMIYTGLGICNVAQKFPGYKNEAQKESQWLLNAIQTRAVSGFMTPHFGEPFSTRPIKQTSVFVHGHFLYLALHYRKTFGANDFDSTIHKIAAALHRDFQKSPVQPSYSGMWYLNDNLPALAALRNYDKAFQKSLAQKPVEIFLKEVKTYYLDKSSGLICTYINPVNKSSASRPQGVGVMYGLIFLGEIDSLFANDQWQKAKNALIREVPQLVAADKQLAPYSAIAGNMVRGLFACLEHPDRHGISIAEKNAVNADSGPVFLGAGTAASGFAVAAAERMGDKQIATGLKKFAIKLGNPVWVESRLYYVNIFHAVGQAIVFFGKT